MFNRRRNLDGIAAQLGTSVTNDGTEQHNDPNLIYAGQRSSTERIPRSFVALESTNICGPGAIWTTL